MITMPKTTKKPELFGINLPAAMREEIKEVVRVSHFMNESEFVRQAIRNELDKNKMVRSIANDKRDEAKAGLASC